MKFLNERFHTLPSPPPKIGRFLAKAGGRGGGQTGADMVEKVGGAKHHPSKSWRGKIAQITEKFSPRRRKNALFGASRRNYGGANHYFAPPPIGGLGDMPPSIPPHVRPWGQMPPQC